jgi:hypothetical protein
MLLTGLNGLIKYSITSGNEEKAFSVSDNGTIFTARPLDRETRAFYQLQVQASDQSTVNPLSSTVQVRFRDFVSCILTFQYCCWHPWI